MKPGATIRPARRIRRVRGPMSGLKSEKWPSATICPAVIATESLSGCPRTLPSCSTRSTLSTAISAPYGFFLPATSNRHSPTAGADAPCPDLVGRRKRLCFLNLHLAVAAFECPRPRLVAQHLGPALFTHVSLAQRVSHLNPPAMPRYPATQPPAQLPLPIHQFKPTN